MNYIRLKHIEEEL